jgi:hypothetical protein
MSVPFVIEDVRHRLSDRLSRLVGESVDRWLDVTTADFSLRGHQAV